MALFFVVYLSYLIVDISLKESLSEDSLTFTVAITPRKKSSDSGVLPSPIPNKFGKITSSIRALDCGHL